MIIFARTENTPLREVAGMPQCRVVAVDGALSDVAQALRERGYHVVDPGRGECSVGAVVLSTRGSEATATGGVPLVVAGRRPAGEVADEVDRRYPRSAPWVH